MFFLIVVERAEGFERVDHSPGVKTAIGYARCLDGGNQSATFIVIQCVSAHHRRMHQPEPQVVGSSRPGANENSWKDRSDRGRVMIGILVEFDQQTNLARAQ